MKIEKKIVRRMYVVDESATPQEKWLCDTLNRSGLKLTDLAKKCHVTKQTISNCVNGKCRLTFPMVTAICYATGFYDDPEEVWNEVSL